MLLSYLRDHDSGGRDVSIVTPIITAQSPSVKQPGAILENCHGFVPFALTSTELLAAALAHSRGGSEAAPGFCPTFNRDCGAYFCQKPLCEPNFVRIEQTLQQYSIFTKYL
jgi:hypothetical protein